MKFLILAGLLAAASAEYHDDTFHFSSAVNSAGSLTKSTSFQASAPVVTKQYTTVQASPAFASFAAQPAYTQQYVKQVSSPVLVKSVEEEIPVFSQKYTAQVAQPVLSQKYTVKEFAQPLLSQKYTVKEFAQPAAFAQQYTAVQKQAALPVSAYSTVSSGSEPQWRILSHVLEADPAGPYKLSYATENGIQVSEQGALVPSGERGEAVVAVQGTYSYTGPDGVVYSVTYSADEGGFRAAGDHLPTPPPIPAEILRSLEESAASGERYDEQGRLLSRK